MRPEIIKSRWPAWVAWIEHLGIQAVEPVERMVDLGCRGKWAGLRRVRHHTCRSKRTDLVDELTHLGITGMDHHR